MKKIAVEQEQQSESAVKNTAEKKHLSKNARMFLLIGIVAAVVVVGAILAVKLTSKASAGGEREVYRDTQVERGNLVVGVTESGSTSVGTDNMLYDVESVSVTTTSSSSSASTTAASAAAAGDISGAVTGTSTASAATSSTASSDVSLTVEEVYAAASQTVAAGDKLLKVTDESYKEAKESLENVVTKAELALSKAKIEQQSDKTEAEDTYDINTAKESVAQQNYSNTINELDNAITTAKKNLDAANAGILEYQGYISNNTYYIQYNVEALQTSVTALTEQTASYESFIAEMEAALALDPTNTRIKEKLEAARIEYTSLQQQLAEAKTSLEKANSEYNTAVANAQKKIDEYNAQLPELELKYNQAVTAREEKGLTAKQTLDSELVTAENADSLYAIEVGSIEESVTSAQEKLTAAQEALARFNEIVQDGVISADFSSMITAMGVVEGSTITTDSVIATYTLPEEVTVTVSVDQEDIAAVAVGNEVNIEFTAYEGTGYTGVVTDISTSTSSGNSSTVSYPVTVRVQGDVTQLYSGMTANVTFVTKEVDDVLYVSNKAINTDGTRSYALKSDGAGGSVEVDVETGFSDGSSVEIVSGLAEGDTVLIGIQVNEN